MNPTRTALAAVLLAGLEGAQVAPLFEAVDEGPVAEAAGVSRGASWGDFDGDGDADLYVTRASTEEAPAANVLYRNDAGRLEPLPGSADPGPGEWQGAVWVDIDADGDLDLHVVGRNGAGSVIYENRGAGVLVERPVPVLDDRVHSASMACWADGDGDGHLDVFFAGYGDGRNDLFRGMGTWRFERVSLPGDALGEGAARACIWTDLDRDGRPEIVVANARTPNLLLRNRGQMRFEADRTTPLQDDTAYGYGVSSPDVNRDGLRDVFVANFDAANTLLLGTPEGDLEVFPLGDDLQSAASKGHVWADFDLDGLTDLYLGSGTPRPGMFNRLYLAEEDGEFRLDERGTHASHADTSAAVAGADFDLDGDVDLFVANWGSAGSVDRLYRNTTTDRSWLRVRLEGEVSNRMGIGARVSVQVGPPDAHRWLHRWLDASTGYAGQDEPVLHFGLGSRSAVDSLVVMWPSGHVDRLGETQGRQTLVVREGEGG